MLKKILLMAVMVAGAGGLGAAPAAAPQELSRHKDWSVHQDGQGANAVFYALARPTKSEGKYTTRGEVYLLITNRPKEKSYNVVSFHAGYPFTEGAAVKVIVDQKPFTAVASGQTCWFPNDVDPKVIAALATGKTLRVEGASARGTKTVDHFSLAGSGAALKELARVSRKG